MPPQPPKSISAAGIFIDLDSSIATLDSKSLCLTPTELQMLWLLMGSPERAFTRLDLLEAARGPDTPSSERTIDVHIKSLRTKLKDQASMIQTVHGVGYRFSYSS